MPGTALIARMTSSRIFPRAASGSARAASESQTLRSSVAPIHFPSPAAASTAFWTSARSIRAPPVLRSGIAGGGVLDERARRRRLGRRPAEVEPRRDRVLLRELVEPGGALGEEGGARDEFLLLRLVPGGGRAAARRHQDRRALLAADRKDA